MIVRTNQMFVRVAEIGECDAKGKTVLGFQFKGKCIGQVDRHLSTVILPFMNEVLKMAHWSSTEARDKDLADFLAYVEALRKHDESETKPTDQPSPGVPS